MIERLVAPLYVSEGALPPHDLELYDRTTRVIARWDGALLDELGSRGQMTANLNAVAAAFNAASEITAAPERLEWRVSAADTLNRVYRTLDRALEGSSVPNSVKEGER